MQMGLRICVAKLINMKGSIPAAAMQGHTTLDPADQFGERNLLAQATCIPRSHP